MFAQLPLTALRAFESAARLGSFAAAADELSVTPAAISHQVKSLEQWLGTLLFERTGQGVRLSETGRRLQAGLHQAFVGLHAAVQPLLPDEAANTLVITTTPAFASLWLIPRLGDFYARCPHLNVRVETSDALTDLARDASVHLAIRATFRPEPDLHQVTLLEEHFAVYTPHGWSPSVAQAPVLIEMPWASSVPGTPDWPQWCALAQHPHWLSRPGRRSYADEQHGLLAAISGHGLVLASDVLVADSVNKGLLQPYLPHLRLPAATYRLSCLPGRERLPAVRMFMEWALDVAKGFPA
ncbi:MULTISPECIES: LysR substrate-binding domain-containing protein [Pseudomonas]|uniref:LysR family transcriptional regulator n=1 Tax=Pseudomonas quercus TaxID=2722792 RepID=A0ABX0Y8K2_9PSED|nr:LysR substrate-binding domain-containing protein [Pseudomonas sp. LY10J]MBF7141104.1 LysR family transcriptional regulator [Pseudomonas sp. LY10J]NJO99638.1 LysR family transcriptional regulator [Pseudomonas quercus]